MLLVPALVKSKPEVDWMKDVHAYIDPHIDDLPEPATLSQELKAWYDKWTEERSPPDELSATYQLTLTTILYPNISYLLKLMLTIPVTSASSERANSTFKFIKSDLRSRLSQSSLNTFILGYKHRALMSTIPTSVLLDRFICMKKRRLYLNNPLLD